MIGRAMTSIWEALGRPFGRRTQSSSLEALLESGASGAGIHVTDDSAMELSSVYACVRVIAETVASLPLMVYKRTGERSRVIDRKHPLFKVLHRRPNPWMTAFTFRETMVGHLVLRGNAYARIVRNGGGDVAQLWPLHPASVAPFLRGDELFYRVNQGGTVKEYPRTQILHLRGMGGDGVTGYSPIRQAREAVALALACEQSGTKLFGNGSSPGGILTHDGMLKPEQKARIKRDWEAAQSGLANRHRVVVLDSALKWDKVGVDPQDAQFLETRRFQLAEIARWFRVPLHLLQDLENASYATVEQQGIDFTVHCVRPWCERIEQELVAQLFSEADQEDFFPKHTIDGLLRGDQASRFASYATARQWGWMSVNDILALEDRNPIGPEGDVYLQPMNMVPAGDEGGPVDNAEDGPADLLGGAALTESVQDTALNGAQIASVVALAQSVAAGLIPAATAIRIILIAFPSVSEEEATALISPAESAPPAPGGGKPANSVGSDAVAEARRVLFGS